MHHKPTTHRSEGHGPGGGWRPRTLLLLASGLLTLLPAWAAPFSAAGGSSLRDTCERLFTLDVAVDGYLPAGYNADELRLIRTQFAAFTPVNCMKMTHLQPEGANISQVLGDIVTRARQVDELA